MKLLSDTCGISGKQTLNVKKNLLQPKAWSLIKDENSTQVFFCKFCKIFQPEILSNIRLLQSCFLATFYKFLSLQLYQKLDSFTGVFFWNFRNFSVCNFTKNEIPAQVSSYELCKLFKNNYFVENLQMAASSNMIMATSSHKTFETFLLKHSFCSPKVKWSWVIITSSWMSAVECPNSLWLRIFEKKEISGKSQNWA